MTVFVTGDSMLPPCCHNRLETVLRLHGLPQASRKHPYCDNYNVPDLETPCCQHAVTVSQEHFWQYFYKPDALPSPPTNNSKALMAKSAK